MKKSLYKRTLCALLFFCVLFSACSQNSKADTKEIESAPPEFVILDDEKEGKENIYLIVKSLDSSYWKVIIDAAADASRDMNCNVYCSGSSSETEWYIQEQLIKTALEKKADAVIIAPDDSVKLSASVNDAYMTGTPTILIDTVVNTEQYDLCYMTDNLMAGQKAAEEMIYELKAMGVSESENAKIAVQVGSTFSQTINERLAGFCQYWAKNAPSDWEIIDEIKVNEGSADRAAVCAEDFFKEYQGIRGVFGCNNGSTVGFAGYVLDNERRDIAVVGFDYSDEMSALVNDDSYFSATLLQRQYDMSYNAVGSALEMIHGEYEGEKKFIDTGVVAVNKSNINAPDVQIVVEHN